ncbi:MAG: cyclic nucleotide-binding domain-containing protein [Fidelibacterota bacterium]
MNLVNILRNTPLTKGLNEKEVESIASLAKEREFKKDEIIFEEDSKGRELYILIDGRVGIEAYIPAQAQQKRLIHTVRKGEIFGEFSLIDGSPRSATARAMDPVKVLIIPQKDFYDLLSSNHQIGFVVMKNIAEILCTRIRNTNLEWRNALIWGI